MAANVLKYLECYDPSNNQWIERAPMQTARKCCASAALDGKLYVVGGADNLNSTLSTVEIYDPLTTYNFPSNAALAQHFRAVCIGARSIPLIIAWIIAF